MNISLVVETVAKIIYQVSTLTPVVIKTIEDAKPFAQAIYDTLIGDKDITPEELAILQAKVLELSNQLQAPLPPATEDEL